MRILAIDTSNQTLTIAVSEDQRLLGEYTITVKKNHSLTLMPAIERLMKEVGLTPKELDRIVVAKGPGSYTGLRIGVTTAKTLAYTLNKELAGVSSLKTLAANCASIKGLIVPLFDARRNNVYTGAYQMEDGQLKTMIADQHIALDRWLERLADYENVFFVGTDVEKFQEQIKNTLPTAQMNHIAYWQVPHGAVLAELGRKAEIVTDIHRFLPDYLKRVEAEENWLKENQPEVENYVEKI
ncbi:tRNA (adenosine(37)-N6)-threonylcarbamoyltransferase complex dimerization subunit type 1 TsaB [Erwinia sp. CPCC 100877]|nr:tRNA (adenosine(37)-N6)-threonylcarbamoyltransferase complex dimerization subunit type 1 TsaB [Erwinia sp. CPCC 100877]